MDCPGYGISRRNTDLLSTRCHNPSAFSPKGTKVFNESTHGGRGVICINTSSFHDTLDTNCGWGSWAYFFVGLGPDVEKEIPFGNASYENLPSTDTAVYAQVSTFARRSGDQTCMVNMKSAEYARSSGNKSAPLLWDPFIHFNGDCYRHHTMALMKSVIWHTPADLITRAWYSALQLPETFGRVLSEMKKMKQPHWLMRWTTFCDFIFIVQLKMSFLCTLYLLLCCALKSHMRALFWFALLVWFTGYPSLQYEFRNYYFMAFLPTLVIFLTVAHVISFLNQFLLKEKKKTDSPSAHKWIKTLQRSVVFLSCVIFSIFTPILVLRMWQVHKIHSLARTLTEAPLQEIEISYSKEEGTCLIVPKETLPGLINAQTLPAGETAWQYLAVEVNTGGEDIPIKIQYEPLQIMYDFSQTITLFGIPDNKKGSLLFFFPVYEVDMNYGETLMASEILQMYPGIKGIVDSDLPLEEQQWWRRGKFKGISVPEDSKHAIGKMYIVSPAEELSWLPIFQLPEDSRYLRCYKTGVIEEGFRRWVRRIKKI